MLHSTFFSRLGGRGRAESVNHKCTQQCVLVSRLQFQQGMLYKQAYGSFCSEKGLNVFFFQDFNLFLLIFKKSEVTST